MQVLTVISTQSNVSVLAGEHGKRECKNITYVQKRWEDIKPGVDIEPHDVVMPHTFRYPQKVCP
jgi:hypothetical protein